MVSLAEQIAERNHLSPTEAVDEFGIPIPTPETPEYLVARALLINTPKSTSPTAANSLHRRGERLYLGHNPISKTTATIYELTHLRRPLKQWEVAAFWHTLKEYAPRLDRSFLQVADDLCWDIEKAELVSYKEAVRRCSSVESPPLKEED